MSDDNGHGDCTSFLTLRNVALFVPEERVPVHQLAEAAQWPATEARLLTRFLGLDRVAVADRHTMTAMLLDAAGAALDGCDGSKVRYLIHAHTMPHIAPPSMPVLAVLPEKLGLTDARVFAVSHQGCVAGLYALKLCDLLLRAEPAGTMALLVVGDKAPSPAARPLRGTSMLGDAAIGVLTALGGPGDAVIGFAHRTMGRFYRARYMPMAVRREYLDAYTTTLADVITAAVRKAGLDIGGIAQILPHNVNRHSWTLIAKALEIPISRIYLDNVPNLGHCYSADPFINLEFARTAGVVTAGDAVVLASAGEGGTFTAAVLRLTSDQ
ncbi:3-oxoacyl-[acyl-carrier-protein] synthase III C-terminal domain-containing protein [Nonomuraea sp. NPDC052265]|uniref:3-oxoacyl-[acyl-carrier-protein] synthase III C-terminal domain-containing protein n=1 Tax=Nonomuraea sp. NPDC052265 TaxID=3364374 RepID=UPI0037CA23AB